MRGRLQVLFLLLAWTGGVVSAAPPPSESASTLAGVAVRENGGKGGLARWDADGAVCPLVSGLPQQEGEHILARLSQIAREAGVPLAQERCGPNLYILISPNPRQLLDQMQRRNRAFTFSCGVDQPGDTASPHQIESFIKTPRPVRVWYNSTITTSDGLKLCADRGAPNPYGWSSRLAFNAHWSLLTAFIVVDQSRLKGVTRTQLADYVSMLGLARINPDAELADTPTVLKLFSGAPETAPAELTVWDRAFLKAVYAVRQETTNPRDQLERLIQVNARQNQD